MKIKKLLSALLAAAMVCGLLCMPALAAGPGNAADAPARGRLWLDLEEWDVEKNVSVTLVDYKFGSFDVEETETEIEALNYVPLGVTFSAGPNFLLFAYSDPDGDGKYEMQYNRGETILPFEETGSRANFFWWGQGDNLLGSPSGDPGFFNKFFFNMDGWRTLTTDYLVDLYGPNTILVFRYIDSYWWFYLTGEDGDAGTGSGAGRSSVTPNRAI